MHLARDANLLVRINRCHHKRQHMRFWHMRLGGWIGARRTAATIACLRKGMRRAAAARRPAVSTHTGGLIIHAAVCASVLGFPGHLLQHWGAAAARVWRGKTAAGSGSQRERMGGGESLATGQPHPPRPGGMHKKLARKQLLAAALHSALGSSGDAAL